MARQTLQHDVLNIIGEQIVSGRYQQGQILRTEDLELEHDVSRTVLRETLKVLESMRLIRMRRRVGITVLPYEEWSVFDPRVIRWRLSGSDRPAQLRSLTDLRVGIEPIAAHRAASRASVEQRDELVALARLLEETGASGDRPAYLEHDIAFHALLLRSSGNEMFAALSDVVAEILTGRIVHHLSPTLPTTRSRQLHLMVANSVAEGDALKAEHAMREILSEVTQQMSNPEGKAPNSPTEQVVTADAAIST